MDASCDEIEHQTRSRGDCRAVLRCMIRADVALCSLPRLTLIHANIRTRPGYLLQCRAAHRGAWTSRTQTPAISVNT